MKSAERGAESQLDERVHSLFYLGHHLYPCLIATISSQLYALNQDLQLHPVVLPPDRKLGLLAAIALDTSAPSSLRFNMIDKEGHWLNARFHRETETLEPLLDILDSGQFEHSSVFRAMALNSKGNAVGIGEFGLPNPCWIR